MTTGGGGTSPTTMQADPFSLPAMPEFNTPHPFGDHIGLEFVEKTSGRSRCEVTIGDDHLNPHHVVHGAVLFAMADTSMGAALYPTLKEQESCATIELKINFFRSAAEGTLSCESTLVHRGRTVANLESRISANGTLVASATGTFAIFERRERPTKTD